MELANPLSYYYYSHRDGKFHLPPSLTLTLDSKPFASWKNPTVPMTREEPFVKDLDRSFYVYFSHYVPSDVSEKPLNSSKSLASLKTLDISGDPRRSSSHAIGEHKALLVFKSIKTQRYCLVYNAQRQVIYRERTNLEDEYLIIKVQPTIYQGQQCIKDKELMAYIKDKIITMNYNLRYSPEGIEYQVSQKLERIIFKSYKEALYDLLRHFDDSHDPGVECSVKISKVIDMMTLHSNKSRLDEWLDSKASMVKLQSLVYKTFCSEGLFPSYVEINTMNESKLWLKLKKVFTNVAQAPWGSQHHASFSLGLHRFSFIFIPGDKSRQNRVNISYDHKRYFHEKSKKNNYLRFKFFDFFPKDVWVEKIASLVHQMLLNVPQDFLRFQSKAYKTIYSKKNVLIKLIVQEYLSKYSGPSSSMSFYSIEKSQQGLSQSENPQISASIKVMSKSDEDMKTDPDLKEASVEKLHKAIAKDFYQHYKDIFDPETFSAFTEIACEAEMQGYSNFQNNCQTVVQRCLSLFTAQFQRKGLISSLTSPYLMLEKATQEQLASHKEKLVAYFMKFSSPINEHFPGLSEITPFQLNKSLNFFGTFSDKRTQKLIAPNNFENMAEHIDKFMSEKEIKRFLDSVGKAIYIDNIMDTQDIGKIQLLGERAVELEKLEMFRTASMQSLMCLKSLSEEEDCRVSRMSSFRIGNEKGEDGLDYSFISLLQYIMYNYLFNVKKKIKELKNGIKEAGDRLQATLVATKAAEQLLDLKEKHEKDLAKSYCKKHELQRSFREICYYYYNSVRFGNAGKNRKETTSLYGFLIVKYPEKRDEPQQQQELLKISGKGMPEMVEMKEQGM